MEMPDVIYVEHSADEWVNGKYIPLYEGGTQWGGNKTEYHHNHIVEALKERLSETVIALAARNSEIVELKAKLDKAKWQPIETAPKDGTIIDIWTTNRGRIVNVAWTLDDFDGSYYWGCENGGVYKPTYWMPLPEDVKYSLKLIKNKLFGETTHD